MDSSCLSKEEATTIVIEEQPYSALFELPKVSPKSGQCPQGFLISHSATLTSNGAGDQDDNILCAPGGTQFSLVKDIDHTDPFMTNTTLLVCVTCLFTLDESDKNIFERYKIGLALEQEYSGKIHTVFVSLFVNPPEPCDTHNKNIELNIGLPYFTQVTSQDVVTFLTNKYFGRSYRVIWSENGILASTTSVTLNEVVATNDEKHYLVPKGTKFRFYPKSKGVEYRLFALDSEHAILKYEESKDVYTVPVLEHGGASVINTYSFQLRELPFDNNKTLTVLLNYYFRGSPLDTDAIKAALQQEFGSAGYSTFNVYNLINPSRSSGNNILTSSVITSNVMPYRDYATMCSQVHAILTTIAGRSSMIILPLAGAGFLPT